MSTVSIVATVESSHTPPRVRLDVTDAGAPELFAVTVTRLNPDGRRVPVRTGDGNPLQLTTSGLTRVGLIYDYEAPFGSILSYSTVEDSTTTSNEVTVSESRAWLIHPGVPALSTPILVSAVGARSRRIQRGVLYPMGRATPVVQTDGMRQAAEYQLSILTQTDVERATIDSLIADAGTLLLNVPATNAWGITAEYVAVGDITENRVSRYIGEPLRTWDLPCVVVDRPAGGSQAERTFVDLLTFATFADLQVAYNDFAHVLAGP